MATLTLTIIGNADGLAHKPDDAVQMNAGGVRPAQFDVVLDHADTCQLNIDEVEVTIVASESPAPIYYGTHASHLPDESTITSWASRAQTNATGKFSIFNINGNYWGIAIPAAFDPPSLLYVDSLAIGMHISDIEIGGVAYKLYMSSTTTFASSLTVRVP